MNDEKWIYHWVMFPICHVGDPHTTLAKYSTNLRPDPLDTYCQAHILPGPSVGAQGRELELKGKRSLP